MQLGQLLTITKARLKAEGIDSFRIDSELIVMEVMGCTRVQLITKDDTTLTAEQEEKAEALTARRLAHEPMQYILGHCEFMGLDFRLNRDTLIPRGDTECLVERVIDCIKENNSRTVLDIGTGSGAIIISLAALTDISGTAVDISENALAQAAENAKANNVADRIDFIQSDLFENVSGSFDIIVSNPPYIESEVVTELDSQVKDYEPLRALDGGKDGLDFYRAIAENAHLHLNKGGLIAFEIGYNQGEAVSKILEDNNFCKIKVNKDLAGLDRTVCGRLK
jgi:release factor glutamine methyltransferase